MRRALSPRATQPSGNAATRHDDEQLGDRRGEQATRHAHERGHHEQGPDPQERRARRDRLRVSQVASANSDEPRTIASRPMDAMAHADSPATIAASLSPPTTMATQPSRPTTAPPHGIANAAHVSADGGATGTR